LVKHCKLLLSDIGPMIASGCARARLGLRRPFLRSPAVDYGT